jgi:hypothetical protein
MVVLNADDVATAIPSAWLRRLGPGRGDRAVGVSIPVVMNNDLPGLLGTGWGLVANTASDHII